MNLYEFLLYDSSEQIDLIYNEGVYVGKRREGGRAIILYQLHGFYIEIYYYQYRHSIDHLNAFSSTDKLVPYLKDIDVEELIRCVG